MAIFADHGVLLSIYKIMCVCWFGIILSYLDNIGQFAQVIGETVGFGQIVHHDSRISFMSILGCCIITVSEISLCVAIWSLSFKKHLPGFEKPHTGLLPMFRCSKASNLIA